MDWFFWLVVVAAPIIVYRHHRRVRRQRLAMIQPTTIQQRLEQIHPYVIAGYTDAEIAHTFGYPRDLITLYRKKYFTPVSNYHP